MLYGILRKILGLREVGRVTMTEASERLVMPLKKNEISSDGYGFRDGVVQNKIIHFGANKNLLIQ